MEPTTVIIWVCVGIFVITAILTVLHISGIRKLPNPQHGEVLFKALIVEIVVISVAAFANINRSEPVDTAISISGLNLKFTNTEQDSFQSADDLVLVNKSTVTEPCLRIQSVGLDLGKQYDVNWEYLDEGGNVLKTYKKTYTADQNPEAVYSCRKSFLDYPAGNYTFKVNVGELESIKKIKITE